MSVVEGVKSVITRCLLVAVMISATLVSSAGALSAQQTEKENDRLENAAMVLKEIFGMPDAIPQDLLDKAECVIVFPSVKKFALGVGGSYGRGVISCRSGSYLRWSVERAGDVRARGRQHRLPARRAGDRLRPARDERSRREFGARAARSSSAPTRRRPRARRGGTPRPRPTSSCRRRS